MIYDVFYFFSTILDAGYIIIIKTTNHFSISDVHVCLWEREILGERKEVKRKFCHPSNELKLKWKKNKVTLSSHIFDRKKINGSCLFIRHPI